MTINEASTVCTARDVSIIHKTTESGVISEALATNSGYFMDWVTPGFIFSSSSFLRTRQWLCPGGPWLCRDKDLHKSCSSRWSSRTAHTGGPSLHPASHCSIHQEIAMAQGAGMAGHAAGCADHATKPARCGLGPPTAGAHGSLLTATVPPAAPSTTAAMLLALGVPTGTARAGRVTYTPAAAPAPASTPGTCARYHTGAPMYHTRPQVTWCAGVLMGAHG